MTGLASAGLTGPLRELYVRELAADPAEALTDRCSRLLNCSGRAGLVIDLVELRWQAAARIGDSAWLVARDLDALRSCITAEDEAAWLRFVLTGLEHLMWAELHSGQELAKRFRQEVEQAEHFHRQLNWHLDRMELSWKLPPHGGT